MDNRKEITNRKIKEAYKKELDFDPEHSPSIKAICITSGINRTTFYRYYDSVSDLEEHLVNEWFDDFMKQFPADANIFEHPEIYFGMMRDFHVLKDNFVLKVMKARGGAPLPDAVLSHIAEYGKKRMGDKYDEEKLVFAFAGGLAVIMLDRKKAGHSFKHGKELPPPPSGKEPPAEAKETVDKICRYYRALKDA